jgi:hypothetical protein
MPNLIELAIDRTSLTREPLVIASDRSTDLVLTSYIEPALVPTIGYAPSSSYQHGETALNWRYAQTGLAFIVGPPDAETETAARVALADLVEALARFSYEVTETIGGAVRVWKCLPGSITPAGPRTYRNLRDHRPQWQVNIPAYPIPT